MRLLEAADGGSHQQSEVQVVEAVAVEAAGGGGHRQREVQAVGAAATEATRVQPEGATS